MNANQSPPAEASNVQLLRQMGAGDPSALAQFYDRHARLLYALARRILKDGREAEAVLEEVMLLIWDQARAYYPGLGPPLSWAITLTRNQAVAYLRACQVRSPSLVQDAALLPLLTPQTPTANAVQTNPATATAINQAVVGLPLEHRQAMEMAFFGGLTPAEIADFYNEPAATVTARMSEGLSQLATRLEGGA